MFIGSEHIITPLGVSAPQVFDAVIEGRSGIGLHDFHGSPMPMARMGEPMGIYDLLLKSARGTIAQSTSLDPDQTLLVVSTTKGEINYLRNGQVAEARLGQLAGKLSKALALPNYITVSQACISGVLSINLAHDVCAAGRYKHVLVVGGDILSDFVISGFQSFYAISDAPCKPYDADRKGINLGEGAASVLVSSDAGVFAGEPQRLLPGYSANDANHISGPSRTGEGLYRTIQKTCKVQVDFISAHGTATAYNDEMESIALQRAGLLDVPMHSLKGYFGHTLGGAGLIETVMSMQSLRNDTLIPSLGFEKLG